MYSSVPPDPNGSQYTPPTILRRDREASMSATREIAAIKDGQTMSADAVIEKNTDGTNDETPDTHAVEHAEDMAWEDVEDTESNAEKDAETSGSPNTDPYTDIVNVAKYEGWDSQLDSLPPINDYTFSPIGDLKKPNPNLNPKQLFLGSTETKQTWARIIEYSFHAAEVQFFAHTSKQKLRVRDFRTLELMYPFRVLKQGRDELPLKAFVRYVFLESGMSKAWLFGRRTNQRGTYDVLKAAVGRIAKVYDEDRGIDIIPDMPRPASVIETTEARFPSQVPSTQVLRTSVLDAKEGLQPVGTPGSLSGRRLRKPSKKFLDDAAQAGSISTPALPKASKSSSKKRPAEPVADILESVLEKRRLRNEGEEVVRRLRAELEKVTGTNAKLDEEIARELNAVSDGAIARYLRHG